MKKISYARLQEKYPHRLVALDRKEQHVLAAGNAFENILRQLKKQDINPQDCIFVGPIQEKRTINVYVSLRDQRNR